MTGDWAKLAALTNKKLGSYKYIGCANSSSFVMPKVDGGWRRCHQNDRRTYQIYCNDKSKIYYDQYSD